MYAELVKDPLIVAVFSALIGVALSQLGIHLYDSWKQRRKRASTLRVLRSQLHNHKDQLSALEDNLGENKICRALDPSPVLHFLNGDVVALPKDEKLAMALYKHRGNIEMIIRAIDMIDRRSTGVHPIQKEDKKVLEQSIKDTMPSLQAELALCLKELPQ